ncbi:uncharacterized protein LOC142607926 isoform X2 [Castanea sativa]|uniref:uncharacterized protein LOC142607926 isoform X2 n=1 Tax=Castanea sativa TaxID=21020 RepID=UPI003F6547B0
MGANRITPSEMRRSCTVALDSVNLSKNCYSDVIPCICRFQIMFSYLYIHILGLKGKYKSDQITVFLLISVDKNRVVLNSCKDYRLQTGSKGLHQYFFLRKHFSVYCHTRSIATNLRGFLGDGNAVSLPCGCDVD